MCIRDRSLPGGGLRRRQGVEGDCRSVEEQEEGPGYPAQGRFSRNPAPAGEVPRIERLLLGELLGVRGLYQRAVAASQEGDQEGGARRRRGFIEHQHGRFGHQSPT